MNGVDQAEYHHLFETIRHWPREALQGLLRDVGKTLDRDERPARPTRGFSADEAIALLKSDRPAPSDEERERILEDELMKNLT